DSGDIILKGPIEREWERSRHQGYSLWKRLVLSSAMIGLPIAARLFARREPLFFLGSKRLVPAFQTRSSSVEPGRRLPVCRSANWMPVVRSAVPSEFVFSASQQRAFPRKFSGLVDWSRLLRSFVRPELGFFVAQQQVLPPFASALP